MNNQRKHNKFSLKTRLLAVERVLDLGWSVTCVATAIGASRQIIYRWLRRFKAEGPKGLADRSSRPLRSPARLASKLIEALASLRALGHSLNYLVQQLGLVRSTVWRWLKRLGMNLRPRPPREPVVRYEASAPGELVHMDIKKLREFSWAGRKFIDDGGRRQRGAQRLYLHVCVDSMSRYGFARILERENGETCLWFIREAQEHFASLGVQIRRILTDNGSSYRGLLLKQALLKLGIQHSFTRVRRPQTNGKAERFIRTAMEEWGYLRFENSQARDSALPQWLEYYNHQRNHSALGHKPPISRLPLLTTS